LLGLAASEKAVITERSVLSGVGVAVPEEADSPANTAFSPGDGRTRTGLRTRPPARSDDAQGEEFGVARCESATAGNVVKVGTPIESEAIDGDVALVITSRCR
jgi:hypothetical protein